MRNPDLFRFLKGMILPPKIPFQGLTWHKPAVSYAMSSDVENTLDKIISRILNKYKRPDLKSLVYTCTKELAINGTKANLKRIFFTEKGLDISH